MCAGTCDDDRFKIIGKAKENLLKSTNIDSSPDEMKVLDVFLFRCEQMGWLNQYKEGYQDKVEMLHDELDALNMKYLSQVSLYKSLYEELKNKYEDK